MAVIGVVLRIPLMKLPNTKWAAMLPVTKQFGAFFLFLIMKDALLQFTQPYTQKMVKEFILQRTIQPSSTTLTSFFFLYDRMMIFARTLPYSEMPKYNTSNHSSKKISTSETIPGYTSPVPVSEYQQNCLYMRQKKKLRMYVIKHQNNKHFVF